MPAVGAPLAGVAVHVEQAPAVGGEALHRGREGVAVVGLDRGREALAARVGLDAGLEIERLHFAGLFATEDQRTGMRSFIENGPGKATFSGR